MTKYKRVIEVEAEEWQPGKSIPGVMVAKLEIVFSEGGGNHYYVTGGPGDSKFWLEVRTRPGEVPEKEKTPNPLLGPFPLQTTKNDGETYWRMMHPFNVWKIKTGMTREATPDEELVKDYAAASNWETTEPGHEAYVITPDRSRKYLKPGDWVVRSPDGGMSVVPHNTFLRHYTKVV